MYSILGGGLEIQNQKSTCPQKIYILLVGYSMYANRYVIMMKNLAHFKIYNVLHKDFLSLFRKKEEGERDHKNVLWEDLLDVGKGKMGQEKLYRKGLRQRRVLKEDKEFWEVEMKRKCIPGKDMASVGMF